MATTNKKKKPSARKATTAQIPARAANGKYVTLTSPDRKQTVSVPAVLLDSIEETAAVEADAELMREIQRARKRRRNGDSVPWETLRAELDL